MGEEGRGQTRGFVLRPSIGNRERERYALAKRSIVLSGLVLAVALTGGTPRAESLREAMAQAYRTNPTLEASRAELRTIDERVVQALAGYWPNLTASGQATVSDSKTNFSADKYVTRGAQLDLRQMLYDGGATASQVNQAETLVEAQRANLLSVEQALLLDTTDAYTATWQNQSVLDLAQNNAQRLRRQLQATRDRFEVGEVARTDVAQAQARLARSLSDIEQARADLAAALASYREIVGVEPMRLAAPEPARDLPATLDQSLRLAQANPDLAAATFALTAAREGIDVVAAQLLPNLDLVGSLSYFKEPSALVDEARDAAVGFQVSVPLYQGGALRSQIREARQTANQRQRELEGQTRNVQRAVTAAWETLEAAKASIKALREQVDANQVALQGVQEEANVGQRTTLDVLDAEQELFTSQVDLVRATANEVLASYQLKQAVGDLTVVALDLDVDPYQPDDYYLQQRSRLFGLDFE